MNVKRIAVDISHMDEEVVKDDLILLVAGLISHHFDTNFRLSGDGRKVMVELYMEERERVLDRLCAIFNKDGMNGKAHPTDVAGRGENAYPAETYSVGLDS